jgi:hypothetical protein
MRTREKLTLEEKFALALELIKRTRSLDEIRLHYRVSHTTAYKIRNTFLEGGRAALRGERKLRQSEDLEARVSALESLFAIADEDSGRARRPLARVKQAPLDGPALVREQRAGK